MVDMHHFYHIYCGSNASQKENDWIPIVQLHIESLKTSQLINKLDTIHIGLVGLPHQRQQVKDFLSENNISHTVVDEADHGWEQLTQNKLYEFAELNDGNILYAHTKGGFNVTEQNINWRKSMTYFNVIKWKDCIEKLSDVDAVGCHWHDFSGQSPPHLGGPHVGQRWFAGTFWWSKLNKIREIGHGPTMQTRWDAEVWIGQIPNISVYDITNNQGPYPNATITEW